MTNNNSSLIFLKPKVAILDDDRELIADLSSCTNNIELIGFTSIAKIKKQISNDYDHFLNALNAFLTFIRHGATTDVLNASFQNILKNRPFSVALIDLNLNKNHMNEGLEVSEFLKPYRIKTLIYSGAEFNHLSLSLINQCVISGYLNKSCDLFEDLLPAIFSLHQDFLDYHYNLTHLAALKNVSPSLLIEGYFQKACPSNLETYIVYDEFFNFLIGD